MYKQLIFIVFLVASLAGCERAGLQSAGSSEGLVHIILVWLKEPGNAEHRQQIIEGTHSLREIPGVLDLHVGEVISSDRPVVEDSYDVGIYLRFANAEDLQTYLTHPTHVNTVKAQFVPIMDRFQVMDFKSQ